MNSDVRVCAVGGTPDIASELWSAAKYVLGENVSGTALTPQEITDHNMADLFITAVTRVNELKKIIPPDKVMGFELLPSRKFFVEVAKIPAGATVHLFHNNARGGERFIGNCTEFGIDHLNFEIIPFQDIGEQETGRMLQNAEYVIGPSTLVGRQGVLYSKYGQYLGAKTRIIAADRVPTLEAGSSIMQWVTAYKHKKVSGQVIKTVQTLTQKMQQINSLASSTANLIETGTSSLQNLQKEVDREVIRVQEMLTLSQSLAEAAKNIGSVADSIKGISDQTNLLALNATIEAARVGEQGRGFAVVAKEVGKLANESKQSIETIRKVVREVQSAVQQIVPAQKEVASAMSNCQGEFAKVVEASVDERNTLKEIFNALDNVGQLSDELLSTVNTLLDSHA